MSSDDKITSRSGSVEVVADQGDDGSFEIRMERQGETGPVTEPLPVAETGAWSAAASTPAATPAAAPKVLLWSGAGLGVAALIGGLVMISSPSGQLNGNRPKTVSVSSEAQFRGYMVEGRSPARAGNLRLAFEGGEDVSPDDTPFDYDQDAEYEGPEATGAQLAPSTGATAVPSARGGAALDPSESGDGEEVDPFAGMTLAERNREAHRLLKEGISERMEVIRQERAQDESGVAADPQYDEEPLDEYGYDDEFDEDYDLYE